MSQDVLLRELEAELRLTTPPPPATARVESVEVKVARLQRLDDELRPADERWNSTNAMAWVYSLHGRICDLSPERLDQIALWVPQTREIRDANRQVNRSRWS